MPRNLKFWRCLLLFLPNIAKNVTYKRICINYTFHRKNAGKSDHPFGRNSAIDRNAVYTHIKFIKPLIFALGINNSGQRPVDIILHQKFYITKYCGL